MKFRNFVFYLFSPSLTYYVWVELIPSFLIGSLSLTALLYFSQAIRLMDIMIAHQIKFTLFSSVSLNMLATFLPLVLPVSVLFAVILSISRLASDGEILALQCSGTRAERLYGPLVLFAGFITLVSGFLSLDFAPKCNRNLEILIDQISGQSIQSSIKAGVFIHGYSGLTLYTEEVLPGTSELRNVFLYDDRDPTQPFVVSAPKGIILSENHRRTLRLTHGRVFAEKKMGAIPDVIDFDIYDIALKLQDELGGWRDTTIGSLTAKDLVQKIKSVDPNSGYYRQLQLELHRRITLVVSTLIFVWVGLPLAKRSRRGIRSTGILIALLVGICFWFSYVMACSIASESGFKPILILWLPNLALFLLGAFLLSFDRMPSR